MENKAFVAVLMGSDSDYASMQVTLEMLSGLQVPFEVNILSAHRTPDETAAYVKNAERRGCAVFIGAAGLAAHLAGAIAANTIRPVIGVPLVSGENGLRGIDALLSTVQMPAGTPVACVSTGVAGAKNAALLAAQILAVNDEVLREQLITMRTQKKAGLKEKNTILQQQIQQMQERS